jgi:hypothetical protein
MDGLLVKLHVTVVTTDIEEHFYFLGAQALLSW